MQFPNRKLLDRPTKAFGNGWMSQIAYSPDGELLAVSGRDGIWLYEAERLTQIEYLPVDSGAISAIIFSPNGKWLASGGFDGIVRLWNVVTGETGFEQSERSQRP